MILMNRLRCSATLPAVCNFARPRPFIGRFHTRAVLFVFALSLGGSVVSVRAQTSIVIQLTLHQTCQFDDEDVLCAEVGARLLAKHVPLDGDIHITAGWTSTYDQVFKTVTSLKEAGYRVKVAYLTSDDN
jgi:hypothetical protein